MKKAIILLTVTAICLSLISCRIFENQAQTGVNDSSYTFLISGIDDAADNTDVILLLDVDLSSSNISVIQIPRDTYFNHSYMQNKINQYYTYWIIKT